MKTGVLRNEDQKSAVRSLREYLDTIKQNRQHKDSTGEGATKERDPARTNSTPVPVAGASLTPGLSTISESTQIEEEPQGPPKLQRLASEEAPSALNVITGITGTSTSTTTTTTTTVTTVTTATTTTIEGEVGGVEDGGGTAIKGQEVVGGALQNATPDRSIPTPQQQEPSNLLTAKRSEVVPVTTPPVDQVTRAPFEPASATLHTTPAATSSQSNITASDHQSAVLPDEERKPIRTNSSESDKGQSQASLLAPPDEKQSTTSEGSSQSQLQVVVQPSTTSTVQNSSSRSLGMPTGPVGPVEGGTSHSEVAATPTSQTTTALQTHELGVVQSEHSSESTPTHFSQGSLESSSSSAISSQEQLSLSDKEKLSADKGAAGTNGTLKKKGQRGKLKQIKLNFVEITDEKVVKCTLVTGTGQMVNFQFSMKYDKPVVMFQKLVSTHCTVSCLWGLYSVA